MIKPKNTMLIHTKELVKTFNKGKSNEVSPVRSVDLQIPENTCFVLQGASGSGKTTLLSILGCLSRPTSGLYTCRGETVSRWSEKFLTRFRRKYIGMVFQQFNLVSGFTTRQNIALPLIPQEYRDKEIDKMVVKIGELVGLQHRLDFPVDQLSGGEQQRVAIARAVVHRPPILLADEPTAHLDSKNSQQVLDLFLDLKKDGRTILLSTHDPRVLAHPLVDEVHTMEDGKINPPLK